MEHALSPFVTDFFTKLGIAVTGIHIEQTGEDINIRVETPDSALLIGMHGKNIEIFQHLLSRMIERKVDTFVHVHLEVNDYMKQKEEKLHRFLDSKIVLIMTNGQSIRMPSLSPYERKKAHGYIADKKIEGLKTQSEGEGISRSLVLSYTGELKKAIISHTPVNHSNVTTTHIDASLSDEGVGI